MKPKAFPISPFPRSLSSFLPFVGGIAVFVIFVTWFVFLSPFGPKLQGTIIGFDRSGKSDAGIVIIGEKEVSLPKQNSPEIGFHNIHDPRNKKNASDTKIEANSFASQSSSYNASKPNGKLMPPSPDSSYDSSIAHSEVQIGNMAPSEPPITTASLSSPKSSRRIDPRSCDLFHGKWYYDHSGPLYAYNQCPIITPTQNCQNNGRPDKDYENWRWKPTQCDLPRFDAKKFLELMRGKTLAFVGDSVCRNHMEALVCALWQVETPKNRGNKRMHRWYFKSTSTMIVRLWSSWLVHHSNEAFKFAPQGLDKIYLDASDRDFMDLLPTFDVVVISSGHWFAKKSAYILNNEVVGGQLWWPANASKMEVDGIQAFRISTETALTAIATHPNFTGLAILRSYSPDHYEGGAWNTGGSCTGKTRPASEHELVQNGFTDVMLAQQIAGFNSAMKKARGRSRLRLMDITKVFSYRSDGHPGPYRSQDPNKVTKRSTDGRPPPQDCLHWCMPGPVDVWNEFLLEIMSRELEVAS